MPNKAPKKKAPKVVVVSGPRGPRSPETCQKIGNTMRDGYAKGRLFRRFGGRGS